MQLAGEALAGSPLAGSSEAPAVVVTVVDPPRAAARITFVEAPERIDFIRAHARTTTVDST